MVNFNEQRAITPESMVQNGPLLILKKEIALNNVTKFHKILIKTNIQLREWTLFQMVNFQKQRAITPEGMVGYRPISSLRKTL